jgi:glucose/arabinose dehydrogenase
MIAELLLVLGWIAGADAAAIKTPKATFECQWADGAITLDGKAEEPAWQKAEVIDQFYLPWLNDKSRAARTQTKARLLWNSEHLYFFAEMEDADLYADVKEHDGLTWENDVFELFFKPSDSKHPYYEFQVNAAGTVMDMFVPRRGAGGFHRFKGDGEFHVENKVVLKGTLNKWEDRDQGWSVEGRIPWKDFERTGGRPQAGANWKFALCRYDYSVDFEGPELSTCAPLNTKTNPDFHAFEGYATLKFVGAKNDQAARPYGIDKLPPLTTSTVVGSPDPPLPYKPKPAYPNLKLTFPIGIMRQPLSDRMLLLVQAVASVPAKLLRFVDKPDVSETEELLTFGKDGVAYGLAFHPKYAENGYLYIGLNSSQDDGPKKTRVVRYTLDRQPPYKLDPESAVEIISWESNGHNGADVVFGNDGMLYVTSGDGTSDSDTNVTGQDLTKLLAKVLRIDVDHPDEGKRYSVPENNPFVGQPNIVPETWAYGLRNPWRITCDPKTGHIWVGNNGQDLWEQVYFVRPGDNFGWSVYEGSHPFYLTRQLGPHPHVKPAAEHHHSEARSLTGGVVYYGEKLPELQGAYIYGDHSTGRIWYVRHDGKQAHSHRLIADTSFNISHFGLDHRGELLVLDHRNNGEGAIYHLEPVPPQTSPSKFPRKLSETGLFASVKDHQVMPGVIPYSVNSPLWSDGAYKERFLAIPHKPNQEMKIEYRGSRGWNFPDETVAIKSFALEMEPGNPASRRWIETRLMTRQAGEWAGYSYRWNEEQTDAELVAGEGLDKEFVLRGSDGSNAMHKQVWHYPSRTECMVCHSRAANWVLGLSTAQFNKQHDYGGVMDNQLRVLEHLGLFKTNWTPEAQKKLRQDLEAQGLSDLEINERFVAITGSAEPKPSKGTWIYGQDLNKQEKLVNPYDKSADLTERAKSYLHANCSICHIEAGGGNAQMELEYRVALDKMRLIDVAPIHHKFGIAEARLVAPGDPDRSVLLHRVSKRGPGQMPQLATNVVDEEAVAMLREWIASLKPKKEGE